ncbi:MAG: hypothetical protein D6702_03200 [Planctomycetota bacterium]|nr:MAG: hypothetical protein D6702_03200 [Planctomycetota bacterium]
MLLLLPLLLPQADGAWPLERPLDRILLVSVDGLRSDALLAARPEELPAFRRILAGTSTLNARPDPDLTLTLPNHTGILTTLPALGPGGHGWTRNDEPPAGATLHDGAGRYLPGIFDRAHDHGLATGLFAGKSKFVLFDRSWDAEHGAADRTGTDDGRDKIDEFLVDRDPEVLVERALAALRRRPRALVLLHLRQPDDAGHRDGWDLSDDSPYRRAVAAVDRLLGRVLADLEEQAGEGRRVGLILTADHGGGAPFRGHSARRELWINAVIPLAVWSPCLPEGRDLYRSGGGRWTEPGIRVPGRSEPPPARNLDAGRIALELLGLPPIHPVAFRPRESGTTEDPLPSNPETPGVERGPPSPGRGST